MVAIGRNAPCHCGSGVKYKKCCLGKDLQASSQGALERLPSSTRVVERGEERFIASSDVSETDLEMAAEYFEQKRRGRGPAQDIADFAQPLIDAADGPATLQNALSLGAIFWNLAVTKDEALREKMFEDIVTKMQKTEEDALEFRKLAAGMLERHRQMFPEMHR